MTKPPRLIDDEFGPVEAIGGLVGGAVVIFLLLAVVGPAFIWALAWTIDWLWSDAFAWLGRHLR